MATVSLLAVDDDLASLELMTELLQQLKAEVVALSDPQEAARLINRQKFDGILLDLKMPVLSGFDLAKIIRRSSSNQATPIVIITARGEEDTMRRSFSVGASYFVQKPVDLPKLALVLDKIRQPLYENRRRFARVPLESNVTCITGPNTLYGVTWNISQGGVQLEVPGLEKGDNLRLSLTLPRPSTVIKAHGVVVWAQDERQGLNFTEMSMEDQGALRTYIQGVSL